MNPEGEIKQFGLKRGASLVGIASAADFKRYAPEGHRPEDILAGAKSVIVVAGEVALRGAWRSPDSRTIVHNRDFPRINIGVAMDTAKLIESQYGYYAIGDIPSYAGSYPRLSLKLAAELAGIGTRSMAGGVILNPGYGLLSLAACITDMPLTPDGRVGKTVCPHPACVRMWQRRRTTPCLEACPECLSGEIERGEIKWMRYDRRICSTRAQATGVSTMNRLLLSAVDEPDHEMRRAMLLGSFARSAMEAIASGKVFAQCYECLRNCPVSAGARRRGTKA